MSRLLKACAIALVGAVTAMAFSTTAQAAPSAAPNSVSSAIVTPLSAPAGCPSGDFCVWTLPNGGGTRCLATPKSSSYWGANCANRDRTLYNNGINDPNGYNNVRIYWGSNHTGAWACLHRGTYWLSADEASFNFGGTGAPGWGEYLTNDAASHKWATTCS
ncbi:peptidase inhibitor family I36 protein [Hamadaea sp. NPDC051192]|uniref:peptidase inhibitor family I36 protein n=1 Tax=Hamadaea sp. NPDC051192 TaxID=3154940 RepID=UPI0034265A68